VKQWFGNSYNFRTEEFAKLYGLFLKNGLGVAGAQNLHYLMLGGLPFMSGSLAREWFRARKSLGCGRVSGTYAGLPEAHDRLFRKKGHFRHQLGLQKIAAGEGYGLMEKVLVLKSNLPDLDRIASELDLAGPCQERYFIPVSYSGHGRSFEAERPELSDLESLPSRTLDLLKAGLGRWKTEGQWAREILDSGDDVFEDWLTLRLTDRNQDEIEKKSCSEIISELTGRTAAAYGGLPGPHDLAERYADPVSQKLYRTGMEAEALWTDRFLAENPLADPGCLSRFNW
jgi:hypothetical protein